MLLAVLTPGTDRSAHRGLAASVAFTLRLSLLVALQRPLAASRRTAPRRERAENATKESMKNNKE